MSDNLTNPENVTTSGGHSDIITATASPCPWRSEPSELVGTNCLIDANGTYVATVANIDAALIVQAVNKHGMPIVELLKAYDALEAERDRLRDLVRRLLPSLRRDIAQCNGPKQAPRLAALLDEASAATGEGVEE